jgi:hypothetical protein
MMFKEDICPGKYSIFSTSHMDYEIDICHKNKRKNDVMAMLLFPDNLNGKVDLAIYSKKKSFELVTILPLLISPVWVVGLHLVRS